MGRLCDGRGGACAAAGILLVSALISVPLRAFANHAALLVALGDVQKHRAMHISCAGFVNVHSVGHHSLRNLCALLLLQASHTQLVI
jgi:hypothetical protein